MIYGGERVDQPLNPLLNVYRRLPLEIVRGEGRVLYDRSGKKYLDLFSGLGVNILGIGHPEVIKAMKTQMDHYIHLSNAILSEPIERLAQQLQNLTFPSQVFFSNSGTEANEAALKVARKWGKSKQKHKILVLEKSFHGRTMGSLSLTAQTRLQHSFTPLIEGVKTLRFNDAEHLEEQVDEAVCAVFLELIQGESGIREVSKDWLDDLLVLRDEYNFLLIIDEIQTGLGRTGHLFSYQAYNFIPDIITLAKPIGGGLPLGATIIHEKYIDVLQAGDHGSTFGGNPVAAAGGNVVLSIVSHPNFLQSVKTKSKFLMMHLRRLHESHLNIIKEVRGKGLMIGIEVGGYAESIQRMGLELGLLLNVTQQSVIRLLPPLTITTDEILLFVQTFSEILERLEVGNLDGTVIK